ncbi:MAG: response regulator receiver domain protein (CheY-like) [Nitrosospira multiformis]|jgi:CheY-like chemotaxis protein|nr:response regulator receiver domain protein (CheY-like) [Nitrosospira multiformis]
MLRRNLTLLSGIKVLIVDDEPEALDVTELLLSFYGAQVITCLTAAQGLERVRTFCPDVIVCDINMPQMNGYQFMQTVRNLSTDKGRNTLAIALSAPGEEEPQTYTLNPGFQRYLCKPVQLVTLLQMVAELADRPIKKSGYQGAGAGLEWLPVAEVSGFAA